MDEPLREELMAAVEQGKVHRLGSTVSMGHIVGFTEAGVEPVRSPYEDPIGIALSAASAGEIVYLNPDLPQTYEVS